MSGAEGFAFGAIVLGFAMLGWALRQVYDELLDHRWRAVRDEDDPA